MPQLFQKVCIGIVFFTWITMVIPQHVFAQVSQNPTNFYNISGEQTVSISFTNPTDQTITQFDAYSDQTYVIMGNGSANLDTCGTSTRMDDGNWEFSDCSIAPGTHANGSFTVTTPNGEYTAGDLGMNYTYGGSSNQVYVTVSGEPPAPTAVPSGVDTPIPTTASSTTTTTTTTRTIILTPTPQPSPTPTPTPVPDRKPPVVLVRTDLSKPYTAPPLIEGDATDVSNVTSDVFYSLDAGKNWSPVDKVTSPNTPTAHFSFTPVGLLDDNYGIQIRSTDGKGNTGVTVLSKPLVIDRLPPMVGGAVIVLGPQVIEPNASGIITTLAHITQRIIVSAVGGPIRIDVSIGDETVSLNKNSDTGLWSGEFMLPEPGQYTLKTHAVDGAGNTTDRILHTIQVIPGGVVTDGTQPIHNAKVSLYVKDDVTKKFVLWDGASFGQKNPQMTDESGSFSMYAPKGTYYIRLTAFGFQPLVSSIFTISTAFPIHETFIMSPARSIHIGPLRIPLPDFRQTTMTISTDEKATTSNSSVPANFAGIELPFFSFAYSGQRITSTSLRGKPTVLTFINTWYPQVAAQLSVLNELSKRKEIHVVGVVPQESESSIAVYRARGAYAMPIVADPDGSLIGPFQVRSIPTHVFLSRAGVVQSVVYGLLSNSEILDRLVK